MTGEYEMLQGYLSRILCKSKKYKVEEEKCEMGFVELSKLEEELLEMRNKLSQEEHGRIFSDVEMTRKYFNDVRSISLLRLMKRNKISHKHYYSG